MEKLRFSEQEDDWQVLLTFLPSGWQVKARELGAITRCRNFETPEVLLRTLFIHLANGCSLRETAARAKYGNLAHISDVALLKRLRASGAWLRWMAAGVMQNWIDKQPAAIFGENLRLRIIDGSTVQEPGSTGSTWRLHYSILLPSLQCTEVYLTSPQVGESFKRFTVGPGDIFLGDRGYVHREGLLHVLRGGGQVLVRINLTNLPLVNEHLAPFPVLEHLRTLSGTKLGDWQVWLPSPGEYLPGRVCALKKSQAAAVKACRQTLQANSKKGRQVRPDTLESAAYTFVFTTLAREKFSPANVLEMYRGRWQIELVFKRLKSIIGLGHLKKTDVDGAKAWLHGKLLVAFLMEALVAAGKTFFPWGYPILTPDKQKPLSVEGNVIHAASF